LVTNFIAPYFEGSGSRKELVCAVLDVPLREAESELKSWSHSFVTGLSQVLTAGDVRILEQTADLAEASLPTWPRERRCLKDVGDLLRLVIHGCLAFDDAHTGLGAMWRLVVTTPESVVAGMEEMFAQLDDIHRCLSAADVMKAYVAVPKLSLLLQSPHRCLAQQRSVVSALLDGRHHLIVDAAELQHSQLSFVRDKGSTPAIPTDITLAQAIVVAMSSKLEGLASVDEVVQVVVDVAELRGLLLLVGEVPPQTWTAATLLNTIVTACAEEVGQTVVDALLGTPDGSPSVQVSEFRFTV
jgi:hypothetical protein